MDYLNNNGLSYIVVNSKNQLIDFINEIKFDILISNGCPYILTVSKMKKEKQIFVNVHPSLLPDLKGINPINDAIFLIENME
jgi:methionyl-tRNA formyltransferase